MCENKYNFLSSLQLQCVQDADVSDVECLREAKRSTEIIAGLNDDEERMFREETKQAISGFRLKRRKKKPSRHSSVKKKFSKEIESTEGISLEESLRKHFKC